MGEVNNQPNGGNEEVDVLQLFTFFENKFIAFFKAVFSIFERVYSLFILAIKALIVNAKILVPLLIGAIALGVFLDKAKTPVYSSEMLVKPYFEAKYQLNANIEYYNSLLSEKDYKTISEIFGVDMTTAKKIEGFEMFEGPETENELRAQYADFIKSISFEYKNEKEDRSDDDVITKPALEVTFEEFVEGRDIFSSDKYMIKVLSTQKDIFQNLVEGLNSSFDNQYSQKNMKKRDSIITLRRKAIENNIKEIDSLQKVYVEAFKENARAKASQIQVSESGFALADNKIETKEYELLEKKAYLIEELRSLEESKVVEDAFFDVIANFQEIGKLERNAIYEKSAIIFPALAFILFAVFLWLRKVMRYIKDYE